MAGEGHGDLVQDRFAEDAGAAEVAARLLGLARGQVAGPRLAMLRLAFGGQSEPLFRSLMGFLLWHLTGPVLTATPVFVTGDRMILRGKPCSIENSVIYGRGESGAG